MSRQYYYTLNSLPYLSFDKPAPIDTKALLSLTQCEIETTDMEILHAVNLDNARSGRELPRVLERWYTWERGLRSRLAQLRAIKLGLDPEEYRKMGDQNESSVRLADTVFQMESPSSAEQAMDKARWEFLEELEAGHHFDLERLIIYFLKLQILERRALFNEEKGRERLEAVIGKVESVWKQEGR